MIQVQLKLRPTKAQARTFDRWLWHLSGVYNWTIKKLESERRSAYDLKALVNGHGAKIGINAWALGGTIATAHQAWKRCRNGLAGRPRLKGRRNRLNSIAFDHFTSKPVNGRIHIPSMGPVRFHRQDIPVGRIGQARMVKRASGWYLCLFIQAEPKAIVATGHGEVGIDPGFSSLLTLSTGEKIEHPRELEAAADRLAQAQRGQRAKLSARLQERIRNRRKNRNHHLSRRLVAENSLIVFSADRHRAIARMFGKSVGSSGHYQLRSMLAYKSRAGGREYIEVSNRNSTKRCSACGALTGPSGRLGLSVRHWTCVCGTTQDRDCNAALNTLIAGRAVRLKGGREAASGIAP